MINYRKIKPTRIHLSSLFILTMYFILASGCEKKRMDDNISHDENTESSQQNENNHDSERKLPQWEKGFLDIHFINTARGEGTFFILPDSTTMLIDAGAITQSVSPNIPTMKPNDSHTAGYWYANYIKNVLKDFPENMKKIDYGVLSHFHYDHMGGVTEKSKWSSSGTYQLGGITDVAEYIPIKKMIDRGWPDYDFPIDMVSFDPDMDNYVRFLDWQIENNGLLVEKAEVGSRDQIQLVNSRNEYPDFYIENVSVNAEIWNREKEKPELHYPSDFDMSSKYTGTMENNLSVVLKLSYGKFDYYTGGDLNSRGYDSTKESTFFRDFETPVARVVGPVDVMKANHHANYDANISSFLKLLSPRVIIITSWKVSQQPDVEVLKNMTSNDTFSGERDIFITNTRGRSELQPFLNDITSKQGHVVVRVYPGGEKYDIYVLDDSKESYLIKSQFGTFESK